MLHWGLIYHAMGFFLRLLGLEKTEEIPGPPPVFTQDEKPSVIVSTELDARIRELLSTTEPASVAQEQAEFMQILGKRQPDKMEVFGKDGWLDQALGIKNHARVMALLDYAKKRNWIVEKAA